MFRVGLSAAMALLMPSARAATPRLCRQRFFRFRIGCAPSVRVAVQWVTGAFFLRALLGRHVAVAVVRRRQLVALLRPGDPGRRASSASWLLQVLRLKTGLAKRRGWPGGLGGGVLKRFFHPPPPPECLRGRRG